MLSSHPISSPSPLLLLLPSLWLAGAKNSSSLTKNPAAYVLRHVLALHRARSVVVRCDDGHELLPGAEAALREEAAAAAAAAAGERSPAGG